jgi:hypothetical protein
MVRTVLSLCWRFIVACMAAVGMGAIVSDIIFDWGSPLDWLYRDWHANDATAWWFREAIDNKLPMITIGVIFLAVLLVPTKAQRLDS